MIPTQGHCEKRGRVSQIHDGIANHPRASKILDTVVCPVVFSALRVVPFDTEPGASCAMDCTEELDRTDVPRERYTRANLRRTGGHSCPGLFLQ